jgi:hypothetical protein
VCECTDSDHEEVDVLGLGLMCMAPCGTDMERTSHANPTCVCVTLYEDLAGTCVLACTGDDIRDSLDDSCRAAVCADNVNGDNKMLTLPSGECISDTDCSSPLV